MYPDAFTIERLATELNTLLKNSILETIYSTSKTELYFCFDSAKGFKIQFFKGQAYFQFPDRDQFPTKNKLKQFPTLDSQTVEAINSHPNSRSFDIEFSNRHKLVFKLYGKYSNVIYYGSNTVNIFCLDYPKDLLIPIENYNNLTAPSIQTFNTLLQFFKSSPDSEAFRYLELQNNVHGQSTDTAFEQFKTQYQTKSISILKSKDNKYDLTCFPSEVSIATYPNILDAFNDYSRLYISADSFNTKKTTNISKIEHEIERHHKQVSNIECRIIALNQFNRSKELGDLLMANLYAISQGDEFIEVTDFYDKNEQARITIALNPLLSPQQNASFYYQKAKSKSKELVHKQSELLKVKSNLEALKDSLNKWNETENSKELRALDGQEKSIKTKTNTPKPYRSYLMNGYTILVGKNAKSNDEILSKYAAKNDLWLHAKDVSGSHVIIKNSSSSPIPTFVIEQAASLAAWHSKSKNNSLAAVVYTLKKYVRKPKGFIPGQVIVEKETGLLVEPKDYKPNQ